MPSGQLKGYCILHLNSFNTYEKVSFSVKNEKSRNNGNDFQKGKNSGNQTVKTPLTSNLFFLVFSENPFLLP